MDTGIYAEGWQSWSPTGLHRATEPPPVPADRDRLVMAWRAERPPPADGFQGEGLLVAMLPGGGEAHAWVAADPNSSIPSIGVVPG